MKGVSIPIAKNNRFRLAAPTVFRPNRHALEIPIDSYLFQRQVLILHVNTILAKQLVNEGVNRYLLPVTIRFKKCLPIPITSNNGPPTGIGFYRLSIDLEPIVQGVLTHTAVGGIYQQE